MRRTLAAAGRQLTRCHALVEASPRSQVCVKGSVVKSGMAGGRKRSARSASDAGCGGE